MIERQSPSPRTPAPRKIAVIRALQLGDLLVAVPALRSLRAGFPNAEITLIGLPWAAGFVQRFSRYLDRLVEFPGFPGLREVPLELARTERFLAEQRAYQYDLVVQMHGSGRTSTPLALALNGKTTAGYFDVRRPAGLTWGAPYPGGSELLRNLHLVRLLGCPDRGTHLEFPLLPGDRREAETFISRLASASHPWIGIHAGARPSARRWPAERFAAVADELVDRYQATIILTGGPEEKSLVADVRRRMHTQPLDLSGQTSLGGLAALISRLDLLISNDTGPAHVAVARDVPSVTLFGPADPDRWAPLDSERHPIERQPVPCSPCGHIDCPIDHRCMRLIEPEAVIAAAEKLLALRSFVARTSVSGSGRGDHSLVARRSMIEAGCCQGRAREM